MDIIVNEASILLCMKIIVGKKDDGHLVKILKANHVKDEGLLNGSAHNHLDISDQKGNLVIITTMATVQLCTCAHVMMVILGDIW